MKDAGVNPRAPKQVSYVGLRIFLTMFSLFFLAGGVSMTLTLGKRVLEKQDWFGALVLIVPFLFGVLGACGLYGTIFLIPWRGKASPSISDKASSSDGITSSLVTVFGCAFFGIFLVMGLAALVGGCLVPVAAILDAMFWTQVPCVILDGRVTQHRDDDSVTFRVSIRYRYRGAGREIVSDTLAPVDKPMRSWKRADALLKQYPPGSEKHCFVSPRDPNRSVLISAGLLQEQLIFGFLGLTFMVVGGGGICFTATKAKQWREQQEARKTRTSSDSEPGRSVPVERETGSHSAEGWILKPKETPLKRFLFALSFAIVWNGFVGIFVWLWWSGEHGSIPWWGKGMIGLFGFFGLLMIWGVGGAFLALFAPRPEIAIDRKRIRLGEPFRVSWKFTGSEQQIPGINLYVEGIEEARSGAGSDMKTDTRTFLHLPIAAMSGPAQFVRGSETVTIPANSMHSFTGNHNTIRWAVRLKAEVKGARALDETFEMQVGPLPEELWKRG